MGGIISSISATNLKCNWAQDLCTFQRRTGTEPIIGFLVSTMGADGCS
jgi:hypothetical protein